jgi:hypothetical protein
VEYTLPKDKEATITYEPIKPFTAGKYILNPAEITYTNPKTGNEEKIKSNSLRIDIKESVIQQGQAQGITTIYRCNGMNMQSTSYSSSGSSFNMQIGGLNIQQQFNQNLNQQQGLAHDRVQNNQLNQNTNALKQQMEQQVQQKKQMEKEFQQNLAQNTRFQKKHQELINSGYNITDALFNVVSNNTGSFELSYQKPDGKTATLKGEMENGTIKNLMSLTSVEKQRIINLLKENKEFQKYDRQLKETGFNQSEIVFNQITQNYTKLMLLYKKGEKEKDITAEYINGTIQNVQLDNENDGKINLLWLILIPILAFVIWFVYIKYFKKIKNFIQNPPFETKFDTSIDYKKETKKMIKEAKKLFDTEKEKDAYERLSQAIRFYFSYKFDIKKEITNTELLKKLRKEKAKNYLEIQRCLNICSMVEFARHRPNKEDFNKIMRIIEKIIM